jgi:broad specificity phosphatase PhoE
MFHIYLLRHGATPETNRVTDPYSAGLTPSGLRQAERLAAQCANWRVQYLVASTMRRSQETADIIHDQLPGLMRRDLKDLEDVSVDDLLLDPRAGPYEETWTPEQRRVGFEQAWHRTMAALHRVMIYAERNDVERIAFVTGENILNLLLYNWLGLGWDADERLRFRIDPGAACRVSLDEGGAVQVDWINRAP